MSEDLDPLKVQKILLGIREEDMALLHINYNFCRPSDLLITHLPAPPVCIRPSVAVT
jgi:DNA-directed RNA polymerase III subunit RPC1